MKTLLTTVLALAFLFATPTAVAAADRDPVDCSLENETDAADYTVCGINLLEPKVCTTSSDGNGGSTENCVFYSNLSATCVNKNYQQSGYTGSVWTSGTCAYTAWGVCQYSTYDSGYSSSYDHSTTCYYHGSGLSGQCVMEEESDSSSDGYSYSATCVSV